MFDVGCELWEEIEDAFVSRLEIQTRIEAWTLELLRHVVDSKHRGLPTLKMVSRELDNVGYLDDGQMRLGSKLSARRFTSATACVYLRTWLVLSAVHGLLVRGERATQRGLFYSLVTCFRDQEQVNRVLKDCTQLLRCSREALGVIAEARGRLGGAVECCYPPGPWIPLRRVSGMRVTECMKARAACSSYQMPPRYILVVEKDAVFHTLVEERIHDRLPMIIVCGGGFPDYATRALLARLYEDLRLPVAGIFDFNPAGVHVFLSYRIGSAAAGLSNRLLHCPLNLLGLTAEDVEDRSHFRPLTDREVVLANNLLIKSPYVAGQPQLKAHLESMKQLGSAEIEAIQDRPSRRIVELKTTAPTQVARTHPLVDMIIKKMLRRKYITC